MKTCSRCEKSLPVENFRWKNEAKGWRQGFCISCNKKYNREHYKKNKQDYLIKALKNKALNKEKSLTELFDYLSAHPCMDCGESDPMVLEFDHREQAQKKFSISSKLGEGYSWNYVLTEIEKCDVRCANCHRRRTAVQLGWRKAVWLELE